MTHDQQVILVTGASRGIGRGIAVAVRSLMHTPWHPLAGNLRFDARDGGHTVRRGSQPLLPRMELEDLADDPRHLHHGAVQGPPLAAAFPAQVLRQRAGGTRGRGRAGETGRLLRVV